MDPRPKMYEATDDLLASVPDGAREELTMLIKDQARDARRFRAQHGQSLEGLAERERYV